MPTTAIRVPLLRARLDRLDDGRLAALAGTGDERAFEVLYDRHHRALLGFCRHLLGSRDEAEDALQQTFLRAHRALLAHGAPDDLRPWLFTIARNRCKTLLASRRPEASDDDQAEPSTDGLGSDVERRADLRALLADLGRLPEDQRSALVLAELADLPHVEIATVIGVPPTKVKALVHQARTRLIAEREARETPCEQIREQLATASGGQLRRGPLRRHLRGCPPCRDYRDAVAEQRVALGLLLPVLPSAGLKDAVLGAITGGGGGGAAAAAAGSAAAGATAGGSGAGSLGLLAKGVGAKLAVGAALAGGAGGGAVVVDKVSDDPPRAASRPAAAAEAAPARAAADGERARGGPVRTAAGAPAGLGKRSRGVNARDEAGGRGDTRKASRKRGAKGAKRGRGDERRADVRSPRGTERSAGAPGQLKTEKGPATGRGATQRATPPEPPGRTVRRRPQTQPAPAAPVQDKVAAERALPEPRSRRSERAAIQPDTTGTPVPTVVDTPAKRPAKDAQDLADTVAP